MNKVERFKEITKKMAETYKQKNANYGDSFSKLYKDLGPIAGLTPLHNKLDRLTTLMKGEVNKYESIEDTLLDLANYAIMNLLEIEAQQEEQNSDECITGNPRPSSLGDITGTGTIDGETINDLEEKDYYEPNTIDWWLPWPCSHCARRKNRSTIIWNNSYNNISFNNISTTGLYYNKYCSCWDCKYYNWGVYPNYITTANTANNINVQANSAESKDIKPDKKEKE